MRTHIAVCILSIAYPARHIPRLVDMAPLTDAGSRFRSYVILSIFSKHASSASSMTGVHARVCVCMFHSLYAVTESASVRGFTAMRQETVNALKRIYVACSLAPRAHV